MNKSEALKLLNAIVASCPLLAFSGFYIREIRASSTGDVELRLLSSIDTSSRKTLNSVIATRGLKLEEVGNLLIIY